MRIDRTLIDLARLEAFDLAEPLGELGLSQFDGARLVVSPSDERLPAAVAGDHRVVGCVVGHRENGAAALIALTFDGQKIGHYELPAAPDESLEATEPDRRAKQYQREGRGHLR